MNASEEARWFKRKDSQSNLKHHLLRQYLIPWASIVKTNPHSFFYDCFAGAGGYDEGDTLGSPLIAAQILNDIQNKHPGCSFHIRNIEHNSTNFEKLCARTAQYSDIVDIRNYPGDFSDVLPTLLNELDSKGERPALFFVDPFGYLDADPAPLREIMSKSKREVLLNLMSYALVRASGIDDRKLRLGIERILGHSDFDLSSGSVESQILSRYCEQFRAIGCYVCTVRIQSIEVPNIYFHLIHITRNPRGLVEMKRAMRKNVRHQDEVRESSSGQLTLSFLEEFDNDMSVESYKHYIVQTYSPRGTVPFCEFIEQELQSSPFDYGEIKQVLSELQKSETIYISGGSHDFLKRDQNTRIAFLSKEVLHVPRQLELF